MADLIDRQAAIAAIKGHEMIELDDKRRWYNHGLLDSEVSILDMPTADVRKNVHAKKVIGGGERDGATCWFECSHCHGTVDLQDMFCKHCGAVLEYEE